MSNCGHTDWRYCTCWECEQALIKQRNAGSEHANLVQEVAAVKVERDNALRDLADSTAGYRQVLKSLRDQLDAIQIELEQLKEEYARLMEASVELSSALEIRMLERAS